MVDGETGYLVPPKDSAAIIDKVIKLFSDRKLLETMSIKARERSLHFSIEEHAQMLIALYEDAIAKFKRRGWYG